MIAHPVSSRPAAVKLGPAAYPALAVLLLMAAAKILYNLPWPDLAMSLHPPVTFISGLAMNIAISFGPSVVYPAGRFRGGAPGRCIMASLITPVAWNIWEIIRVTQYFSLAESLYYGLNALFLGALAFAAFQMGLWETVFRIRRRKEGRDFRLSGPVLAALAGLVLVYMLLFQAMGQTWFYISQEGYKAIFS